MYYLQSRYYDAKICRLISADGYVSTGPGAIVKPFSSESSIDSTDYVCYNVDEDKKVLKEIHYEKHKKISIVFSFRGFNYFAPELQYAGEAL